jgi:hypothetical protein
MRETYLSVTGIPQEHGTRSLLCDKNKFCGKVFPILRHLCGKNPQAKGFPLSQEFNKGEQKFSL